MKNSTSIIRWKREIVLSALALIITLPASAYTDLRTNTVAGKGAKVQPLHLGGLGGRPKPENVGVSKNKNVESRNYFRADSTKFHTSKSNRHSIKRIRNDDNTRQY